MTQGEDFQRHTLPRLQAPEPTRAPPLTQLPPSGVGTSGYGGSLHRRLRHPYKSDSGLHLAVPSSLSKRRSSAPLSTTLQTEEPPESPLIRRQSLEKTVPTFGIGKRVPRGYPSLARRTTTVQSLHGPGVSSGDGERLAAKTRQTVTGERVSAGDHQTRPDRDQTEGELPAVLTIPALYLTPELSDEDNDIRSDMGTIPSSYHLPSILGTHSRTMSECDSASSRSFSRRGSEQLQQQQLMGSSGQRRPSNGTLPNIHKAREYPAIQAPRRSSDQMSKIRRNIDRRGSDSLLSTGGDHSSGTVTTERRHSDDLSSHPSRDLSVKDTKSTDTSRKQFYSQTKRDVSTSTSVKSNRRPTSISDKDCTLELNSSRGANSGSKSKFKGFFEPPKKQKSKQVLKNGGTKRNKTESTTSDVVDPLAIIKASLARLMRQTTTEEPSRKESPPDYVEVPSIHRVILTPAAIEAMDTVRPTPFVSSRQQAFSLVSHDYNPIYESFEEIPESITYDKFEFVCKWLNDVEELRSSGALDGEIVSESELSWSFGEDYNPLER